MSVLFKRCRNCGNLVEVINNNAGVPVNCCGLTMPDLVPNTVEASGEKHKPVVTVEGSRVSVNVGSVNHPMLAEHYIEWIALETSHGIYRRNLKAGDAPAAVFQLTEEAPVAAYTFCNLHGLWKTEI